LCNNYKEQELKYKTPNESIFFVVSLRHKKLFYHHQWYAISSGLFVAAPKISPANYEIC
jgi:hypothetical protein